MKAAVVCDLCFARMKPCVTWRGECRVQQLDARSCATLDIQVAHEGSGYVECTCGVELDQTRHGVVCGIKHLVNFLKFEFG